MLFHHDPNAKVVHKHYYDSRPSVSSYPTNLITSHPESRLTRLVQPTRPSSLVQPSHPSSLASFPPRRVREATYVTNSERLPSWFATRSPQYNYQTAAEAAHESMIRDLHPSPSCTSTRNSERYAERYAEPQVGSDRYYDFQAAYRSQGLPSFPTSSRRTEKEKKKIELERRGEELVMVRRRGRMAERDGWRGVEQEVEWVRGWRWR
jgi:hypothetical protein